MSNKYAQKGQSLMEVVVAAAVGILVVTALTFATLFSLRSANFAKASAQATKLAQEGIERVRAGRDRNQCITNLDSSVNSWNGGSGNSDCPGSGAIWSYPIKGSSNNCENTTVPNSKCFFKVDSDGNLTSLGLYVPTSSKPFPSLVENIPYGNQVFKRAVILSDDPTDDNYKKQKQVTVIVSWDDPIGSHQSELTTILGKL